MGRKPTPNISLFPNQRASKFLQSQHRSTNDSQFVELTYQVQEYLQQMQKRYIDSLAATIPILQPPPISNFQFNPNIFRENTPEK